MVRKTVLANRYWLQQRIMPRLTREAWRASDLATGRTVAVLLPRAACAARAECFLTTAAHAARIRHPGIARIHDFGRAGPADIPFAVTELVGGAPLAAVMRAGPLEPAWVLDIVRQVTSALGAAHCSDAVHLDISPWSLRLAPGGTVKVTGLCPPQGDSPAGGLNSDLFSLGLVAWSCLAGESPDLDTWPERATRQAGGQEARQLPPLPSTVPAGVAVLAADLTADGPAVRSASATEVLTRCGELLAAPMRAGQPGGTSGPGSTRLFDAPTRRLRQRADGPQGDAARAGLGGEPTPEDGGGGCAGRARSLPVGPALNRWE
jgi:eukaryotic-like serine/threonine-protein kinase